MKKEERQRAILELLNPTDPVQNKTLIEHFHVTDMTIRRDLNELAAQGKLIRTFGGAVLVSGEGERVFSPADSVPFSGLRILEPAYMARVHAHSDRKAAIARACSSIMEGKSYIYLDSGSTTFSIARLASPAQRCAFLTNGVNIAAELLRRECASVISIGGEIDLNTWSTRGTFAENQIRALHADIAFMGCNAISPEGAVMIGNMTETGVKQAIMEVSHEIYLVADSSKFDTYSLTTYASVRDFTGIISDALLPAEIRRNLEALGAKICIAE